MGAQHMYQKSQITSVRMYGVEKVMRKLNMLSGQKEDVAVSVSQSHAQKELYDGPHAWSTHVAGSACWVAIDTFGALGLQAPATG